MANTVKLKRSSVANKVPLTTDLQLGEIAVNTNDGRLYMLKNDGSNAVVEIGSMGANGAIHENSSTIAASYTMRTNYNGVSAGPVTINSGVTVTVPTGSVWVIV